MILRLSFSVAAPATLLMGSLGGCYAAATDLPEVQHDAYGVSVDKLGHIAFPSPPKFEKGVEQPSARWQGETWAVNYGLIERSEQEVVSAMEFTMDCADLDEMVAPQKVLFRSLRSSRFKDGQEGRLYLEAWASNESDCETMIGRGK